MVDTVVRAAYRKTETASILGVSLSLLDKMIRKGQIKIIRVGERGVRISHAEIERLVNKVS